MASTLLCPRCKVALVPHRLQPHLLRFDSQRCERCGGVFLGAAELEQVEVKQANRLLEFRRLPDADAQQAPLACPGCGATMAKSVSQRDEAVVMDSCATCRATWLDGGELAAIETTGLLDNVRAMFASMLARRG